MSIEEKKEKIYSINKRGLSFVKGIEISRNINNGEASTYEVSILLSNIHGKFIIINAKKCIFVSIGNINKMLSASINLIDASKNQLEGSKYILYDTENDLFKINCFDFEEEPTK